MSGSAVCLVRIHIQGLDERSLSPVYEPVNQIKVNTSISLFDLIVRQTPSAGELSQTAGNRRMGAWVTYGPKRQRHTLHRE